MGPEPFGLPLGRRRAYQPDTVRILVKFRHINRVVLFFTVVVPSAVSNIFTGVRLGLGTSITCVVAAEMLVGSDGLGYLINSSKLYYKTSWAFAGIVTLAVIGFAMDRILLLIGKHKLKHFGVK